MRLITISFTGLIRALEFEEVSLEEIEELDVLFFFSCDHENLFTEEHNAEFMPRLRKILGVAEATGRVSWRGEQRFRNHEEFMKFVKGRKIRFPKRKYFDAMHRYYGGLPDERLMIEQFAADRYNVASSAIRAAWPKARIIH
jgi:hypothetical protein